MRRRCWFAPPDAAQQRAHQLGRERAAAHRRRLRSGAGLRLVASHLPPSTQVGGREVTLTHLLVAWWARVAGAGAASGAADADAAVANESPQRSLIIARKNLPNFCLGRLARVRRAVQVFVYISMVQPKRLGGGSLAVCVSKVGEEAPMPILAEISREGPFAFPLGMDGTGFN